MAYTYSIVKASGSAGDLRYGVVDVTLDATAYVTGGMVLSPALLGGLLTCTFGQANVKTTNASSVAEAFLDCSTPSAPKLKLNTATAELAAAATSQSGLIVEIVAYGGA